MEIKIETDTFAGGPLENQDCVFLTDVDYEGLYCDTIVVPMSELPSLIARLSALVDGKE